MEPDLQVDMRTVEDLDRNLAALALLAGRSMSSVIEQASLFAVRSAAKATPMAGKNRAMKRHHKQGKFARKKHRIPWWSIASIEVQKPKASPVKRWHFSSEHRFQAARQTPRRKLAKNVWISRANKFKQQRVDTSMIKPSYGRTRITRKGGNIDSVSMSNSLRYIQDIAPNSARIAIHNTDKFIEGFAIKQVERKLLRKFYSGARAIRS